MKWLVLMALLAWWPCHASEMTAQPAADPEAAEPPSAAPFLGGFLKETRVIYPLRHEGWEAKGEHLYDAQELGASVRYVDARNPDRWLDLYFYPAGVLTPQQMDASMRNERETLLGAARPGTYYTDMELGPTQRFGYRMYSADGKKGDKARGYSVDLQMVREGQSYHSAMTLQVDRLYFIKGRLSAPADEASRAALRRQLEKFAARLIGRLTLVSTGECWRPLPIEPIAAADRSPQPGLTLSTDGEETALVVQDRVFAADPASSEAQLAMMLGMATTGRLVPGCEPMEQLNQPVNEGMRELRLEYRSAEPVRVRQQPVLKPKRVGRG